MRLRGQGQPGEVPHGFIGHTHALETHQRELLVDLGGEIELAFVGSVAKPRNPSSSCTDGGHQADATLGQTLRKFRQFKAWAFPEQTIDRVLNPHMEALVENGDMDRRSDWLGNFFERGEHRIALLVANAPKFVFKFKFPCNSAVVMSPVIPGFHPCSVKSDCASHLVEVQDVSVGMNPGLPGSI